MKKLERKSLKSLKGGNPKIHQTETVLRDGDTVVTECVTVHHNTGCVKISSIISEYI